MKAQLNIEFILGVGIIVMIVSFIGFSIINNFPALHSESEYEVTKSKTFQVSQVLLSEKGNWTASNISNCSSMGLTDGEPYVLNASKVKAIDKCTDSEYIKLKDVLGLDMGNDLIINFTLLNFSGGSDTNYAECRPRTMSLTAAKFWIRRLVVIQNVTRDIAKMEVSVYGYG